MGKCVNGWKLCLLCLLAAVLLAGCHDPEVGPRTYTVRYTVGEEVVFEQAVVDGEYPAFYSLWPVGASFAGWQDEQGQIVEPSGIKVTADVTYRALIYPQLTGHVPYLTLTDTGLLQPEEALTADALAYALETLAADGARDYFPKLPAGTEPVDAQTLTQLLRAFYAPQTVEEAVSGEGTVTRAQFAAVMHQLLGREDTELLAVAQDVPIPADVNRERPDAAALLEACVPHTSDANGINWLELDLTTTHEPGYVNLEGYLYYVEEDRTFLRDGDLGGLHFGADGRYTSGDAELDALVAEYLKGIIEENPGATRLELLKIAYEHSHRNFKYLRRDLYYVGQTGWEVEDAKEMITTGRGNCYNFAAVFWAYARGLGYEARAISGTCTDTDQPHGWVIIAMDGEDYFFDPEWQYAYRDRGERGRDMFMIPKAQTWYWSYKWKE